MAGQAGDLGLDERGAIAGPGPGDRVARGRVAGQDVVAVHDHAGDAVARRAIGHVGARHLARHRDADRVAVVLDDEDERQLVDRREVQALVDVALVAAPLPHARHRDLAGLADLGRERDPDRVEQLRRHRRRDAHEVVLVRAVVAGHLATAGARVVGGRVLRRQDVARAHPEREARGDRAIERGDPVVTALERPGDADLGALVALTGDDERDPPGAVQDPHPLVERPGQRDVAVHLDEVGVGQADRGSEAPSRVAGGGAIGGGLGGVALGHGHRGGWASVRS